MLAPTRTYLEGELKQLGERQQGLLQRIQQIDASGAPDAAIYNATSPLLADLTQVQNQYTTTYGRLQDLTVQQSQRTGSLAVQQTAQPPPRPADPDPLRYLPVGIGAGLVLGFLLALLAERFDSRIRDTADLAQATGSGLVLDL